MTDSEMASRPQVHKLAQSGFNVSNDLYDRARPSYPSDALSLIRKTVGDVEKVNIAEIGSGTGIFTRALLAHPEWSSSVGSIRAIEPSEGMRKQFEQVIKDERVTVKEGTFDNTGVEDGWADLIVVAQAFHWCPDFNAASREFARILKPNGVAILIWNFEDRERAGWVGDLRDLYEVYEQGSPQFRLQLWRQTFDTPSYKTLFIPPEEKIFEYYLPANLDIVSDRVCSKSYIAVLEDGEKAKVRERVKGIVEEGKGLVFIDKEQGTFKYPYKTFVEVLRKK